MGIKENIKDLEDELSSLENDDLYFVDPRIQYLRNRVFYVHARIESCLEFLLVRYLTSHLKKEAKTDDYVSHEKASQIFDELSFKKKVDICVKYKKLNGKLYEDIVKVNKMRNNLSHPKRYKAELNSYELERNYLNALNLLLTTLKEVNKLYVTEFSGSSPFSNINNVKFMRGKNGSETLQWDEN